MCVACLCNDYSTAGSSYVAVGKKRKRVVLSIEDKFETCTLVKSGRVHSSEQLAHFFLCTYG